MTTPTILDRDDCGWVATLTVLDQSLAVRDTCVTRTFIAYIQRAAAPSRVMILREDLGDWLGPPLATLPGPMEGIIQLRAEVDAIIVTYTGRLPGDDAGPFMLQKARIAMPGIWPIDLAALMRVRNVARIIDTSVPGASPAIDPYLP